MVSGKMAQLLNVGAILILLICIIGKLVLSHEGKVSSDDVTNIMYATAAFLFGTHVTPMFGNKKESDNE
jgi:hypothetical protein